MRFMRHCVLTAQQMRAADAQTIAAGTPSYNLMERAGRQAAHVIQKLYAPRSTLVLCGSGNNGGDGYVLAELLRQSGWPVQVAMLAPPNTPDAIRAAQSCTAKAQLWQGGLPAETALVVDALFGTGLSRPIEVPLAMWLEEMNRSGVPVVSLDMPSGICADSGRILGAAIKATHTVSFCCLKRGHLLQPGRQTSGELHVVDIGISQDIVMAQQPECTLNHPSRWQGTWPQLAADTHKYRRGHVAVLGGAQLTGAARLASLAALRSGAGLVSVLCPPQVWPVYAASLMSVMTKSCTPEQVAEVLADERINVWLLGPGAAAGWPLQTVVQQVLNARRTTVLDADALSCFAGQARLLAGLISSDSVITPHEGEFAALFAEESWIVSADKCERAGQAARLLGAVTVLKGADTVIAAPDGRLIINDGTVPQLATAGSGDVLSGMIAGLLAQRMPAFEAAAAAVWMHTRAAQVIGKGMIAEDLIGKLPYVIQQLSPL